ncbi:MAG: redoxin domain-containing protein [Pirellulales bacterium]|nr:redoxin domain-containing protein [Pirellulales bacterium]
MRRMQGRPFVLLGVNSDSKSKLRATIEREQMTWRSWWDGSGGSIAAAWKVEGWPTMYVLDHHHVVRQIIVGPDTYQLDRAVERLVDEAERAAR